jgi:hypothetical protein
VPIPDRIPMSLKEGDVLKIRLAVLKGERTAAAGLAGLASVSWCSWTARSASGWEAAATSRC